MIYHAPSDIAAAELAEESVDVCFDDSPYNIQKVQSSLPKYDKSESIIAQKWTDFSASWDDIQDYWSFTRTWLASRRRILKPTGSLFTTGTYHNIPVLQLVLKELGFHIVQWIAWCKPNSFPNRELDQQSSSNEVIIHARKSSKTKHFYNVDRAKDYAVLDYWRVHGVFPYEKDGSVKRVNLRDFWLINNDSRAVKQFPFLVHGAKKPPELVARCIDITLPEDGGVVFDGFLGSGTTGYVCKYLNDWIPVPRLTYPKFVGSDIYIEYARMAALRNEDEVKPLPGGLILPAKEREKIRVGAEEWASFLLDGTWEFAQIPELVRRWDAKRAVLNRPIADVRTGM